MLCCYCFGCWGLGITVLLVSFVFVGWVLFCGLRFVDCVLGLLFVCCCFCGLCFVGLLVCLAMLDAYRWVLFCYFVLV